MARNWGLPNREERNAFRDAQQKKPLLTLIASVAFGIIGAAIAAMSFTSARGVLSDLFHGASLIIAVVAAGFGCWIYVWLARPRFAAHFSGAGDPFSSLLKFYVRAGLLLIGLMLLGQAIGFFAPQMIAVTLLCISGGAGAAAAFQTVLTFVPRYEE